jgi:hypothetical protein
MNKEETPSMAAPQWLQRGSGGYNVSKDSHYMATTTTLALNWAGIARARARLQQTRQTTMNIGSTHYYTPRGEFRGRRHQGRRPPGGGARY